MTVMSEVDWMTEQTQTRTHQEEPFERLIGIPKRVSCNKIQILKLDRSLYLV